MTAEIPRYEITDNLHESQRTLVHRGRRYEGGAPVILKVLKSGVATAGEVARFRREFEFTARAQVLGVIGAQELGECRGNLMMVLEDIGGESLNRRYGDSPMPLAEFWRFAVWLAGTLAGLHQLRIIHQDINPAHVVHDPATGRFRLIDFGLAEQLPAPPPPRCLLPLGGQLHRLRRRGRWRTCPRSGPAG